MKKILLLYILVISCSQRSYIKKPDPFIEKEKMEDIYFDMILYKEIYDIVQDTILQKFHVNNIEELIFEKYNINNIIFQNNNRYYLYKTKEYQEIISNIVFRMEKLKPSEDSIITNDVDKEKNHGY